ncbi:hypothetical protein [Thioclava indica]|uniref:UrcA family protein n=1 Tax=Thioclava indica TaxID=1353528 RepID=A0A074JVT3_9RHOB|nr:hypothetical protein [Thioclava indica]KEO60574.1 hypothetical protein DT23_03530 [Thioclava indica]
MTRHSKTGFGAAALILGLMLAGTAGAGDLRQIAPVEVVDTATKQGEYDPVAHALATGLTPERADAMLDSAMQTAQSCPMVFDTRKPIAHCWEGLEQTGS